MIGNFFSAGRDWSVFLGGRVGNPPRDRVPRRHQRLPRHRDAQRGRRRPDQPQERLYPEQKDSAGPDSLQDQILLGFVSPVGVCPFPLV